MYIKSLEWQFSNFCLRLSFYFILSLSLSPPPLLSHFSARIAPRASSILGKLSTPVKSPALFTVLKNIEELKKFLLMWNIYHIRNLKKRDILHVYLFCITTIKPFLVKIHDIFIKKNNYFPK
jgi:hypothetical protein